jgi:hypothetical protein
MVPPKSETLSETLIRKIAKSRDMFETPELNECIMAQGLGLREAGDLSAYIAVRCIFIERNCLRNLAGLVQLSALRYVGASFNLIETLDLRILDSLKYLEELHVSGNQITRVISPTDRNGVLRILRVSSNRLTEFPDLSSLDGLEIVDLSHNYIACDSKSAYTVFLTDILPKGIKQLYLKSNPFLGMIKNYKALTIASLRTLVFLDNSEVKPGDSAVAVAEITGGPKEASTLRRQQIQNAQSKRDKELKDFRSFQGSYGEVEELRRELMCFIDQSVN